MAENPKKESEQLSVMEIAEQFQRQLNPLSYHLEKSNGLLGITNQYEYLNSAASIADIASKAVQPVDFASINVVDHSVLAKCAQLRVPEAMAVQDAFLEMTKGMSAYNNSLMSLKERMIQSIGGTSVYEDMMASANLVRKSIEPYRGGFDTARVLFEASEPFRLARELKSQATLANSLSLEYSNVFEQFESVRNLESFKAIARLKNFPSEKVWTKNYDEVREITEDSLAEAKNIDAMISDEVSSVDDFNDLSEETQNSLKKVFSEYYEYFIIEIIVSLCLLQEILDKDLDLSSKSFVFVDNVKGSVFFIDNYWNQNKAEIIRGLITNAISSTLIWFLFTK